MNLCLAELNAPAVRKHGINSFESSRTLLLNQSLTFGDCADDASLVAKCGKQGSQKCGEG